MRQIQVDNQSASVGSNPAWGEIIWRIYMVANAPAINIRARYNYPTDVCYEYK